MDYKELEKLILSSKTSDETTSEEILSHFKSKYDMVPYYGDVMFFTEKDNL